MKTTKNGTHHTVQDFIDEAFERRGEQRKWNLSTKQAKPTWKLKLPKTSSGKGFGMPEMKMGYVPAMLLILVTFGLSVKSALLTAQLLQMSMLAPLFIIGYLASEALVISWIFEPQNGKYNKRQMSALELGKWYVLIGGFIEGVLLLITVKSVSMGQDVEALAYLQAGVGLSIIFVSAGCSIWIIKHETKRIISIEQNDVELNTELEKSKLDLERAKTLIAADRMKLQGIDKVRRDMKEKTFKALNTKEAQTRINEYSIEFAGNIVEWIGGIAKKALKSDLGK